MPENRSRFVLLCQQVLAFGTVVAVAAPAASIVTLDIVAPTPPAVTGQAPAAQGAGSLVASEPVEPQVAEVPITGVDPAGLKALTSDASAPANAVSGQLRLASAGTGTDEELAALTAPEPVSGYATVGVTWKHGEHVADEDITVSVRSLTGGTWSDWEEIEYHDEHAPDPGSEEARTARPGTDPIVVGDVDEVQVKAETVDGEVPADMKLALVDPGASADAVVEEPAIDTAELGGAADLALSSGEVDVTTDPDVPVPGTTDPGTDGEGVLTGSAADVTPKPLIYSRAQWGADERMRDKSSLGYYEIHAGFVHHTVNSNGYSRRQVPSLMRGIYAYHTQSRGWSDIGYNFIVDRFGRIWEGRFGGVDRPVVGAHTLGYNESSFAMSALGNFDTARPSSAMLDAYGRLFAWKLSLHGIDASSTKQWVGSKYFQAINGHRDAGQTACPGRHLYAQVPAIRSLAVRTSPRFNDVDQLTGVGDMSGDGKNDLVVRQETTKRLYLFRGTDRAGYRKRVQLSADWSRFNLTAGVGDFNGDGDNDLVARDTDNRLWLVPGNGARSLGTPVMLPYRWGSFDIIAGMGDATNDGTPDIIARKRRNGLTFVYPGDGNGGLERRYGAYTAFKDVDILAATGQLTGNSRADLVGRVGGRLMVYTNTGGQNIESIVDTGTVLSDTDLVLNAGDWNGDGHGDLMTRSASTGRMYFRAGQGGSRFAEPVQAFRGGKHWRRIDLVAAVGDVTGDGYPDLMGQPRGKAMRIYPGNGSTGFRRAYIAHSSISSTAQIGVGLWNGDGTPDSIVRRTDGSLLFFPGNGPGGLMNPSKIGSATRRYDWIQGVGDANGDGHPDVMARQRSNGTLWLLPGNGAGFDARRYVADGFGGFDLSG